MCPLAPISHMRYCKTSARKQAALLLMIFPGGPNGIKIGLLINPLEVSAVAVGVTFTISQPAKCSTEMSTIQFPLVLLGQGPAKSIQKTSKRIFLGISMVVRYRGIPVIL